MPISGIHISKEAEEIFPILGYSDFSGRGCHHVTVVEVTAGEREDAIPSMVGV